MATQRVQLLDLGRTDYRTAWSLQQRLHAEVASEQRPDIWIFVEHDPVVTLGRNAQLAHLRLSEAELKERGVDCVRVERGGDATYHGPGQLVVYPIRRLARFREVVPLVRTIEGAIIDACAQLGVHAERWSEHAGIWVGTAQICAVGLAIQKMTSFHGLALNCTTVLDYDELITPCGLSERGITSLSRELGREVSIAEARPIVQASLAETFELEFEPITLLRLEGEAGEQAASEPKQARL